MSDSSVFVPVLTILPETGGPFIWVIRTPEKRGVGPCLCDGMGWDESMPLSEGLFLKFSDWQLTFEMASRDAGYSDDLGDDWDWAAFHTRGLQLACWLKEEVGAAYRVVYAKPYQDPNCHIEERQEILMDGSRVTLPPFR